ncbi:Uma2 family endonuclease [Spirulina major CS-329]|uniref:Uma2 family endonuclease n=1 Tax=Spirulina TaxID=1154 RepID=UPI002330D76A|nr:MULTISPECIES: Uma2 family endonuclease [Spirulina]MDB9493792.1 Uma2 family endonuclease [Spirulina subsalsa CS-330]MDB9505051.1 Uma2 family endonuclease [Spirulina major CS-329]
MVQELQRSQILYPDSDGLPMSDNTLQFHWIVTIKENLELLFADDPNVFVAGDLLWYPIEGDNRTRRAPDVMVAIGRPKGYRGSYKQWEEGAIAPQVVFEILSPGNRLGEMAKKWEFYHQFGVSEYYLYDPDRNDLTGWQRQEEAFTVIPDVNGWESPLLKIRFELTPETLLIYKPNGDLFLSYVELGQLAETAKAEAETAKAEAETAKAETKTAKAETKTAKAEVEQLKQAQQGAIAHLRTLGLTPEQIAQTLSLPLEDVT